MPLNECDVKIGAQKQDKKTHVSRSPIDDQGHLEHCGVLGGMMRAVGCPLRDFCKNGWDDSAEDGNMRKAHFISLGFCSLSLGSAEQPAEGAVGDSVECLETLEDENSINRMLEKVPTRLTSPKTFSPFPFGDFALRFSTVPNCKR